MEIRGRGEAGAAGAAESAVAPAGGRRPCAPQPWRLLLSRRPPPPPLLPDKGRFNQVGREGGRTRAWEGRGKEPAHSPTGRGLPPRTRSRSGRRLPSRPPSPKLKSTSPPASCARLGPSPGAVAAACCARLHGPARRRQGAGGGALSPPLVPLLVPEKGGWVVARAKFPALDSCEITTAH